MKEQELTKLRTELDKAAYTGLTNKQAADAVNAPQPDLFGSRRVNYHDVLDECASGGDLLDKLESAASTFADIKWAMYGIKTKEGIDIGNEKTQAQIDLLVGATLLTSPEGDALKAMAPRLSIAKVNGWGKVKESEVKAARALP